jgi:23S rRNA pseudouridine955/2504/2580 synthase
MQVTEISSEDNDIRLDRFFKRHYQNIPFTIVAKLARKGRIKINGKKADVSTRLKIGDSLEFPEFTTEELPERDVIIPENAIKEIQRSVLHMDDDVILLNKPAGLAVQGGSGIRYSLDDLAEYLKFDYPQKPKLVHRLDKETSGIIVMARKVNVAARLGELFRFKKIDKIYLAIIKGVPSPLSGKIDISLEKEAEDGFEKVRNHEQGKKAVTYYQVIDDCGGEFALVALKLITGRTHQIRAHLSMIGHPILFDDKYGDENCHVNALDPQLYLHAYEISFNYNDEKYQVSAPFPKYFNDALKVLGLNVKNIQYNFSKK